MIGWALKNTEVSGYKYTIWMEFFKASIHGDIGRYMIVFMCFGELHPYGARGSIPICKNAELFNGSFGLGF